MARGKSVSERAKIIDRQIEALDMRRSGFSYRKIAQRLGISHGQAHNDVLNALAARAEDRNKEADLLVQLELERLDMLMEKIYMWLSSANPQFVTAFLKIAESRRKLLGLDAPTKIVIEGGVPVEVINEFIRQAMTAGYDASDYFNELIRDLATHPAADTTGT